MNMLRRIGCFLYGHQNMSTEQLNKINFENGKRYAYVKYICDYCGYNKIKRKELY